MVDTPSELASSAVREAQDLVARIGAIVKAAWLEGFEDERIRYPDSAWRHAGFRLALDDESVPVQDEHLELRNILRVARGLLEEVRISNNALVESRALLEAIEQVSNGESVSDFMMSFPLVRLIQNTSHELYLSRDWQQKFEQADAVTVALREQVEQLQKRAPKKTGSLCPQCGFETITSSVTMECFEGICHERDHLEAEVARLTAEQLGEWKAGHMADHSGHMFRCAKVNGKWVCAKSCAQATLDALVRGLTELASQLLVEVEEVVNGNFRCRVCKFKAQESEGNHAIPDWHWSKCPAAKIATLLASAGTEE